jgi:hypothetical protein
MAAPNLKNPSMVTGKTATYACTDTLASALANGSSSGKLLKVNTVRAANITSSSGNIDLTLFRSSIHTYLVKSASVPPNGSLVLTDKNEYVYLEEGDSLYAKANDASTIDLTIHYEDIS